MTDLTKDISLAQTLALIDSYDFDLGGYSAEQLLQDWLNIYHTSWIRLATIEALYQGRYKTISIEQILGVWLRMGNPNTHFSYEFERLICRKLPRHLMDISNLENVAVSKQNVSQTSKPSLEVELTGTIAEYQEQSNFAAQNESNDRTSNLRGDQLSQLSTISPTFPPLLIKV